MSSSDRTNNVFGRGTSSCCSISAKHHLSIKVFITDVDAMLDGNRSRRVSGSSATALVQSSEQAIRTACGSGSCDRYVASSAGDTCGLQVLRIGRHQRDWVGGS